MRMGKRRLLGAVQGLGRSRWERLIGARPTAATSFPVVVLLFVMTPIARVQAQSTEEFICTLGADHRIVSVVKTDTAREPQACRVDYTRNGSTTTLWSSKNGYVYCVAKATSLVTKLAEANYSCKPQSVNAPDDP